MRILHVIQGFTGSLGGLSSSVFELLTNLQEIEGDCEIQLLTPLPKESSESILGKGCKWIIPFENDLIDPIGFSINAKRYLKKTADIYHINGLWQYIDHITCQVAHTQGKPYIISPHGMLYPAALKRRKWKKFVLRKLWFDKDILNATCFHATCYTELLHIRNLGYKGPIAVIGNPLNIPKYTADIVANSKGGKVAIGFLGRLHPIKCIDHIIKAMSIAHNQDVEFIIMGKGTDEYESYLKDEIHRYNLSKRVRFLGFLDGYEKYVQLGKLSALFVPSEMENFGMIVLEALSVGTPVMASLGTPWESLNEENCGWWTDNSPESIASVIDNICSMSKDELRQMGQRGREMVLREYEAGKIASKMMQLYNWIGNKGEKPDFVYEN